MFTFPSRAADFNIQVMVGNNKLITNSPSQFVNVQDTRLHEEYDPKNRKNDIALLKV
jgi:secreted trypsin-like serine protease